MDQSASSSINPTPVKPQKRKAINGRTMCANASESPEKFTKVDLANTLIRDRLDLLVSYCHGVGGASLSSLTMTEANSSSIIMR